MLGVDERSFCLDRDRSVWHVQLFGVECIDGNQTLGVAERHAPDLSPEHLARAVVDVRIVTGGARERARAAHDRAHLFQNPATPQDLLVRNPVMRGLADEFARRGVLFRLRRGAVWSGPVRESYSVGEATTALALLVREAGPELGFLALDRKGRNEVWRDQSSRAFRSLFDERTRADGVRTAIAVRRAVLEEVEAMSRVRSKAHWHLLADAPDLVVWAVGRELPVELLHREEPEATRRGGRGSSATRCRC
ncbi:hypothetical protein K353_02603 [Kitasatospora sp. SolWspMP-SS2h]|nr:hypothetical protein K353_02603 [Kitasatospora sp. SolWspMP-SS2h]